VKTREVIAPVRSGRSSGQGRRRSRRRSSSMGSQRRRSATPKQPRVLTSRQHVERGRKAMLGRGPLTRVAAALQESRIALSIALPHETTVVRYANNFAQEPTIVAAPFLVHMADFSPVDTYGTANLIPNGEWRAFASRNPFQSHITWEKAVGEYVFRLKFDSWSDSNATPVGPQKDLLNYYRPFAYGQIDSELNPACLVEVTTTLTGLHGGTLFSNTESMHNYFFVQANASNPATICAAFRHDIFNDSSDFETNCSIVIYRYLRRGEERPVTSQVFTTTSLPAWFVPDPAASNNYGSTYIQQISETGYYRLVMVSALGYGNSTSAPVVEYAIEVQMCGNNNATSATTAQGAFSIQVMPDFLHHSDEIRSMRSLAVSALLTVDAPELSRGGRVSARQLPEHDMWWLYRGDDSFRVGSTSGGVVFPGETGVYGFLKPTSEDDFRLFDPYIGAVLESTGAAPADSSVTPSYHWNPISPPGGWLMLSATGVTSTITVDPTPPFTSAQAHLTLSWSMEYTTNSTWFMTTHASVSAREWSNAFAIIKDMPQFHENPFHFSDITNWLKGAAKTVWNYAPRILGKVSEVVPELKPAAVALSAIQGAVGTF